MKTMRANPGTHRTEQDKGTGCETREDLQEKTGKDPRKKTKGTGFQRASKEKEEGRPTRRRDLAGTTPFLPTQKWRGTLF